MQRLTEPIDTFPISSSEMQQCLVSGIKARALANAPSLESVKWRDENRFTITPKRKETFLESRGNNSRLTAVKIMPWGFLIFLFQWRKHISLFLDNSFVVTQLNLAIKIAIQKSILYSNVRQLRFQLLLSNGLQLRTPWPIVSYVE